MLRPRHFHFVRLIGAALLTLALSCSDSTSPSHGVSSVLVRLPHDSLFFGRSEVITAIATGDSATVVHPRFIWSSSDTTVAVVDSLGTVLGVGIGTARIAAELNGQRDEYTIRVVLQRADGGVAFTDGSSQESGECAVTGAGAVYCRETERLTDSTKLFRLMPGSANHHLTDIHTALSSQCGLATDGIIYCWGDNSHWVWGTRALGVTTDTGPVPVKQGALRFSAMSEGGHKSICGIGVTDSVLYCWGHNDLYQLGRATNPNVSIQPDDSTIAPVGNNLKARAVSVANQYACALDLTGAAYCWGSFGGLFLGGDPAAQSPNKTPLPVVGGLTFASIYANWGTTCALTPAGDAYCWGDNSKGQLGGGTNVQATQPGPNKVVGGHQFASVSGSLETGMCGITTAGDLYCWGEFSPKSVSDRLGAQSYTPRKIAIGAPVRALTRILGDSMCAITTDGRILCW